MKTRSVIIAVLAAAVSAGCSQVDLTEVYERLDTAESRLDAVELRCSEINASMGSIKALAEAVDKNYSITSKEDVKDELGNVIGYTITLSNGESLYIPFGKDGKDGVDGSDGKDGTNGTDGKDGKDGVTPVIGVQEKDGTLCWTVNGDFLTDASGNPIRVSGEDGMTPSFEIKDDYWYVCYPDGTSKLVGPAVASGTGSGSPFSSVVDNGTSVTFTLSDGKTSFTLAKELEFSITLSKSKDVTVLAGSTAEVSYTINSATGKTVVETLCEGGYQAEVLPEDTSKGLIRITVPPVVGSGKVLVFAADGKGKTDMKAITFEEGVISLADDARNVSEDGGVVTFSVSSNMSYRIEIPEDATWITLISSKAVTVTQVSLNVEKNTGKARSASVSVIPELGAPLLFVISQERNSESLIPASLAITSSIEGSQAAGKDVEFTLSAEQNSNLTDYLWSVPEGIEIVSGGDERTVTLKGVSAPLTVARDGIKVKVTSLNGEEAEFTFGKYLHILDGVTAKRFGSKAWTLTNLNYAGEDGTVGRTYPDDLDGASYGRYYTWREAMTGSSSTETDNPYKFNSDGTDDEGNPYILNNAAESYGIQIQGICPEGWHIPNAYD
ncbi:MAG: PL29 family lyase N-terminal domain-containing protein, partial [Candidatus Cryptobacteroides sp.]